MGTPRGVTGISIGTSAPFVVMRQKGNKWNNEGADTTAPSVPGNFTATAVSTSQINLSWSESTDPLNPPQGTSGLAGYRLYRSGSLISTQSGLTFPDTGLAAGTPYNYTVEAYDNAGNVSSSASASAQTQSAGTGTIRDVAASSAAVNAGIAASANGDTVRLPLNGSATWSAVVSLPSTKYITLDLNGSTITLSGASGEFTINSHASGLNRITNGIIIKAGTAYSAYNGPFKISDTRTGYGVRVDHIEFRKTSGGGAYGTIIDINGHGPGVMDHCTFSSGFGWADEFIHINGWGDGNTTGWTTDSGATLAGSGLIFYIEDCTFTGDGGPSGVAWIQGYYGARACLRYNTFDWVSVDAHGTPGQVGQRWWECYENTFDNNTSSGQPDWAFSMRAGSGVIYNNRMAVGAGQNVSIGLCEEDSGYPALYQIGRGLNQTSDPAYVWNNGTISLEPDAGDAPEVLGMVQLNRDVYASARPGYTAYTYPHPFIT